MNEEKACRLGIRRLREDVSIPQRAHLGDAGLDIAAAEDCYLEPGEAKAIPTGIALDIPLGYEVQVRPRSGLSLRTPLRLPNSPGTIDHGYRDELKIIMANQSCHCMVKDPTACYTLEQANGQQGRYLIRKGERIAQLVVSKLCPVDLVEVQETTTSHDFNRGGGFGSSGVGALEKKDSEPTL